MNSFPFRSFLSAAVLLAACGEPNQPAPGELLQSKQQRITDAAPDQDIASAVEDETTFAFDVYRKLKKHGENLAFSPRSISAALAMTYAGARSDTAQAFESTLHLSMPAERFHRAMNTIDRALASRGEGASGTKGRPFRLRQNNQLFAAEGFTMLPDYLDVLAREYGAGVRVLDFAREPEPSRKRINAWVATNTEGLIPELLQPGFITNGTVLTLVNTLYFNAAWKAPFSHSKTRDADFTLADGSTVQVPTMEQEDAGGLYQRRGDIDVVELPYQGDDVSMVILAPPAGKLAQLESELTAEKLKTFLVGLEAAPLVRLPKFEARTGASLAEALKALGLAVAFSSGADFSGINREGGLAISDVVHEAYVKVDEDGTEAAAATAVGLDRTSLPSTLSVDRPFLFLIRDRPTGALLFVGSVEHPQ